MYKIKQKPEDFIVKEIIRLDILEKGQYCYFLLKKKNYTTLRAIEYIAKALKIDRKRFGFAGTKDKLAVTEQAVSVLGVKKEQLEKIELKDIGIKFLGYGENPISLGDLDGNEFEIIVRDVNEVPKINGKFVNYFGEQRFSKNNHHIGKAIIKGKLKEAVGMILESEGDVEEKVREKLDNNENDYVGALRTIHKKLLKMYVHAYQSWIWNKAAEELVNNGQKENVKIYLVGFSTEFKEGEIDQIIKNIIKNEEINVRDFIIRQIPNLSSEGDERELFAEAQDLKIEKEENLVKLIFKLKKGSYATVFIDSLFG